MYYANAKGKHFVRSLYNGHIENRLTLILRSICSAFCYWYEVGGLYHVSSMLYKTLSRKHFEPFKVAHCLSIQRCIRTSTIHVLIRKSFQEQQTDNEIFA